VRSRISADKKKMDKAERGDGVEIRGLRFRGGSVCGDEIDIVPFRFFILLLSLIS